MSGMQKSISACPRERWQEECPLLRSGHSYKTLLHLLEPEARFELATYGLQNRCSNQLSYSGSRRCSCQLRRRVPTLHYFFRFAVVVAVEVAVSRSSSGKSSSNSSRVVNP